MILNVKNAQRIATSIVPRAGAQLSAAMEHSKIKSDGLVMHVLLGVKPVKVFPSVLHAQRDTISAPRITSVSLASIACRRTLSRIKMIILALLVIPNAPFVMV